MTHYFDVISLLQAFRSWRQRTILIHETGYDAVSRGIQKIHAEFSPQCHGSWVSCLDK